MNNPFRRKVIHVAVVTSNDPDGEDILTLCGKVHKRQQIDVTGKVVRMCGTCLELQLREYPADELNDLLSRMHDASHLLNDIIHPINSIIDLHESLVQVFNRDGAAATKFKRG